MSINPQTELPWIAEARRHIGLAEIPGKAHNPTIIRWLAELKAWWRDDETPWCGTFVAHCLRVAGRDLPMHWYRASAYAAYGKALDTPAYGCIAVLSRQGGGHVGFVIGKDRNGNLLLLGGNQGNRVSVAAFSPSRITRFVWPSWHGAKLNPQPERYQLPEGNAAISKGEA